MRISNRKLIILIAGLFLLSVAIAAVIWLTQPEGTQVVITHNGKEYGSYSLHTDRTIVIGPEDGSWHNTLQIKNGMAEIIESDCDNQVCVYTPPLREDMAGIIVCLPHGLAIELK